MTELNAQDQDHVHIFRLSRQLADKYHFDNKVGPSRPHCATARSAGMPGDAEQNASCRTEKERKGTQENMSVVALGG